MALIQHSLISLTLIPLALISPALTPPALVRPGLGRLPLGAAGLWALILGPIMAGPLYPEAQDGPPDFAAARQVLVEAIKDKAFPGCAVVVGTDERVLWKEALGSFDYEGGPRVDTRSIYDLASLTKVVGTTSVILSLVRDGRLSLSDPVSRHIPEFSGKGEDSRTEARNLVTVERLLTHSSGLPAWRPLYKDARSYDEVLAQVVGTPLECLPGTKTVYSDLGFILLGEVAARAGGKPLADLERQLIFEPLGLRDTTRRVLQGDLARVVPTEKQPAAGSLGVGEPTVAIRGVVHDENAAAGGGKTGHAGLFSTADDLQVFAAELLRGYRGGSRIFPRDLLRTFVTRRGIVPSSSRALGWDTPSEGSSAGKMLSAGAFGHTGFTGTSLWVDPDRDLYILLLSNRVHPTRDNPRIMAVRKALADAVILCLEGKLRPF